MVGQEQGSLRRFLLVLCCGDSSRADDIAQEALLKAYLCFEKFEGRSRFSTWLFRIAYNCYYDSLRVEGRRACEPLDAPGDGHCAVQADVSWNGTDGGQAGGTTGGMRACDVGDETSGADRRFMYQDLYQAIGMLSAQEQAVILLFYMEEKSVKEICDITGMPSGTVRSHLSRGRAHLKVYLEKMI